MRIKEIAMCDYKIETQSVYEWLWSIYNFQYTQYIKKVKVYQESKDIRL